MVIGLLGTVLAYIAAALMGAMVVFGICVAVARGLAHRKGEQGPWVLVFLLLGGAIYGAPAGAVLGIALLWSFLRFGAIGPTFILGAITAILLVESVLYYLRAALMQAKETRDKASAHRSEQQTYRLLDAARVGSITEVSACLDAGTFVDTFEVYDARYGETALMLAARKGDAALVQLLLERGARLDWRNARGETAQTLARNAGFSEVADLLIQAENTAK